MKPRLIWKKTCDSCRRFKKALDEMGVDYEGREMNSEPLDAQYLSALMGEREVKPFLNTRNVVYREQGLSKNPPSRAQAIALMSETNNLLRRPVLIVGDEILIGADLDRAKTLLSQ
tara:strand:+ start:637 stop:984 length:348 start_codon:yes stop_codon:yes gene_type:complete